MPEPPPGSVRIGASVSGTAQLVGGGDEIQGSRMVEFRVRVGGSVTMDRLGALTDALERAAVLAVRRFPNCQIEDIGWGVG